MPFFPASEPSLKQGKRGLHLLFLFDPEIGRDGYMRAFNLAMGGVSPWREKELQISSKSADDIFRELREFHRQECPIDEEQRPKWSYIALAPHIDNEKGLLAALNAQVLKNFPLKEVTGLELGDGKLPDDAMKKREWLPKGMATNHLAFFHGSDAYSVHQIGKRHTWLKVASPRIEALRQAFIASDSRIRIGYVRDGNGALNEIANPPDVTVNERPWLKSVTVAGRASFFGATGEGTPVSRFELSPDLTCVIGGSMTGKSTLLDGLRLYTDAQMPQDEGIKRQVEARGKERFLGGSPEVCLDCPGQDPTAPDKERWPAVFYAQNELQRLAQEPGAVEEILATLVPSEICGIAERQAQLSTLDKELDREAKRLAQLDEELTEADQAYERTKLAVSKLAAFSKAGVEKLHEASRGIRRWQESCEISDQLATHLDRAMETVESFELPVFDDRFAGILQELDIGAISERLQVRWNSVRKHILSAKRELKNWNAETQSTLDALKAQERRIHTDVDRALAELGLDGSQIKELQALNVQASLRESYKANLDQVRNQLCAGEKSFATQFEERERLVEDQRDAFDRVIKTILVEFKGRISARRVDDGSRGPMDRFVRNLGQRGITRWWNEVDELFRPAPKEMLEHLRNDTLNEVGMSGAVQATFCEQLTKTRQRFLAAIRCSDLYLLELKMDDGSDRRLDDLSGGQRVSLLLSLLLETSDPRPPGNRPA